MNRKVIVFLLILSISSTFSQSNKKKFDNTSAAYELYLNLIDKHYNCQANLINNINYYKKIREKDYVLSGSDLKKINIEFSKITDILKQSISFYKIDLRSQKNISNNLELTNYEIMSQLISIHLRIKSFETFILQQKILGHNIKIINLINEETELYKRNKNSLNNISKVIISDKFRKSILKSWLTIKNYNNLIFEGNQNYDLLKKIKSSVYFQDYLKDQKKIKDSKKRYTYLIKQKRAFNRKRSAIQFSNTILFSLSKVIGNVSGLITIRKGKLINNIPFINATTKQLQPLDVVIEKTPFRLTDKFIPGYWGHAAIYVGNENQLKELGVWENLFVKKYHNAIKNGACIIEALRSDVAFNTIKHFTNIDDFAHIRLKKALSLSKKREMVIRAFAQIGKKYDFRFDVESSKKIMCTELHYIVFEDVDYVTTKNFGRSTLSADKIAEQALKNGSFKLIDLYIDGKKIDKSNKQKIFLKLLSSTSKKNKKHKKSLN